MSLPFLSTFNILALYMFFSFFWLFLNQTAKHWDVVAASAWGNVTVLCAECEHLQIKHEFTLSKDVLDMFTLFVQNCLCHYVI